jgi:hypothetical protein
MKMAHLNYTESTQSIGLGHYPSSGLLFKTQRFGNWILSPPETETSSIYWGHPKTDTG